MNFQEFPQVRGDLQIQVIDSLTGNIKEERNETNLVVTVGRNWIAARFKDTGIPTQMTHMEVGQGTTTPVAGNTGIETAFSPAARVALATAGGSVSGNQVTYSATFPAGTGTGPVTEAAIFNASTAGTMLCRTTFGVLTKTATDIIVIQWVISVLAA